MSGLHPCLNELNGQITTSRHPSETRFVSGLCIGVIVSADSRAVSQPPRADRGSRNGHSFRTTRRRSSFRSMACGQVTVTGCDLCQRSALEIKAPYCALLAAATPRITSRLRQRSSQTTRSVCMSRQCWSSVIPVRRIPASQYWKCDTSRSWKDRTSAGWQAYLAAAADQTFIFRPLWTRRNAGPILLLLLSAATPHLRTRYPARQGTKCSIALEKRRFERMILLLAEKAVVRGYVDPSKLKQAVELKSCS